jgi:fimbrial isopeptide formation D2 family protein/LPXTG-motif cell wall-anchored protein
MTMKLLKKLMVVFVTALMLMSLTSRVYAQTVGTAAEGKGSITINNAAKGETYSVVKIFGATITDDATETSDASGIAYTGDVPEALNSFFEKDSTTGNIKRKASATDDAALIAAVQAYAKTIGATATAVSDGSPLVFQGLDYGYYAVISTQGATVTIDSLMPNAVVNDKNSKVPSAVKKINGKDQDSASIGETVTYTATFDTANYIGSGENAWQVRSYTISDTLPEFLKNVTITGLTIIQTTVETDKAQYPDVNLSADYTGFTNKEIIIPWVDNSNTSLYKNGSVITITYTAVVTDIVNVDTANTNTVSITPNKDKEGKEPHNEKWYDDAKLFTYGTALKKVDGATNKALKGAKFQVPGLTVVAVDGEPGVYKVVSYVADSTTAGTPMVTNNDGKLYILGLKDTVTLSAIETEAPKGYNKADAPISLPAQTLTAEIYETSGIRYYDADGNLVSEEASSKTHKEVEANYSSVLDPVAVQVVNNKGAELPSTGGIGTTIFHIAGAALVLGAGILLISKKRMNNN